MLLILEVSSVWSFCWYVDGSFQVPISTLKSLKYLYFQWWKFNSSPYVSCTSFRCCSLSTLPSKIHVSDLQAFGLQFISVWMNFILQSVFLPRGSVWYLELVLDKPFGAYSEIWVNTCLQQRIHSSTMKWNKTLKYKIEMV